MHTEDARPFDVGVRAICAERGEIQTKGRGREGEETEEGGGGREGRKGENLEGMCSFLVSGSLDDVSQLFDLRLKASPSQHRASPSERTARCQMRRQHWASRTAEQKVDATWSTHGSPSSLNWITLSCSEKSGHRRCRQSESDRDETRIFGHNKQRP
eukprot:3122809-Rhodomonas_salina.1